MSSALLSLNVQQKLHCQVAIVGGGSAGICSALALSNLGIRDITVIESSNYDQFRIGESIPPEIKPLFIGLGIWEKFLELQQQPCYGSRSWWGDELRGHNDSILNPRGHGWHLNRVAFNRFLAEQAQAKQIRLLTSCQFEKLLSKNTPKHQLQLSQDYKQLKLEADFVVDASGIKGSFAKAMGSNKLFSEPLICSARRFHINSNADAYPLTGLTHIEAVESGWWYAARLPEQQILLSHTTDSHTFRKLQLKQVVNWEQQLNAAPNTQVLNKNLTALDKQPRIYNAASFVLDKSVGDRWLAVGDSASCFDPVTSQGIIKSVSDGIEAAKYINQFLLKPNAAYLQSYEAQIKLRHKNYRQMRQHYYQLETRFKESSFWQNFQ